MIFFFCRATAQELTQIRKLLPVLKHGSMHAAVQVALFYLVRVVCVTDNVQRLLPSSLKKSDRNTDSSKQQKNPVNKEMRREIVPHSSIHLSLQCFLLSTKRLALAMPHLDRIKVSSCTEVSSVTGTWRKLPQPDLCCLSLSVSHTHTNTAGLPHLWAGPGKGEAGAQWCCLCLKW